MTVKHLASNDLISVARAGGGLRLSARSLTPETLISIARAASTNGATIIVEDSQSLTRENMISIGRAGGSGVIFE